MGFLKSVKLQLFIIGKQEKRACSNLAINDCKSANSIKYCYCTWDNCNGIYDNISKELDLLNQDNDSKAESDSDLESDSNEDEFFESSSSDIGELEEFNNFTTTQVYNNMSEIYTKNSGIDCNFKTVFLLKLLYLHFINFRKL